MWQPGFRRSSVRSESVILDVLSANRKLSSLLESGPTTTFLARSACGAEDSSVKVVRAACGHFLAHRPQGQSSLISSYEEEGMKRFCLFLCGLCVVSGIALAQAKSNVQWKCDKPAVQHNIDVGDKPGHAYAIGQINCTAIKGEIAGIKMKSGTGTEFLDVKGDKTTGHGEFVESMENGDKNYYKYEFTGTSKNGAFESGSNKWSMTEGGGKMKGGKASGTCTAKGNADGSTSFDCMGTYTPAAK